MHNMGVFALGITGVSFQQYNVTFGEYLNGALRDAGDCFFNTIPLFATTALFAGFQQHTIDFSFVEPTNYACLVVSLAASRSLGRKQFVTQCTLQHTFLSVCRTSLVPHLLLQSLE